MIGLSLSEIFNRSVCKSVDSHQSRLRATSLDCELNLQQLNQIIKTLDEFSKLIINQSGQRIYKTFHTNTTKVFTFEHSTIRPMSEIIGVINIIHLETLYINYLSWKTIVLHTPASLVTENPWKQFLLHRQPPWSLKTLGNSFSFITQFTWPINNLWNFLHPPIPLVTRHSCTFILDHHLILFVPQRSCKLILLHQLTTLVPWYPWKFILDHHSTPLDNQSFLHHTTFAHNYSYAFIFIHNGTHHYHTRSWTTTKNRATTSYITLTVLSTSKITLSTPLHYFPYTWNQKH